MSDEHKDLTGENVHGIKDGVNWNRWKSWDEKPAKKEEPKVAEPEPVAEEPAPAPEPAPEPAPAVAGPHQKKAARKMAASLGMSREECLKQIMDDPELFKKYSS